MLVRIFFSLFLLAGLAAAATDVSGKWSGSMDMKTPDGQISSTPVSAELKQMGDVVTGTAGVQGQDQLPVADGSLKDGQLAFVVHAPDGDYAVKMRVVSDSELKGEVTFSGAGGTRQTSTLSFSRSK